LGQTLISAAAWKNNWFGFHGLHVHLVGGTRRQSHDTHTIEQHAIAEIGTTKSRNEEMRNGKWKWKNEKRERNEFHTAAVLPGQFHYPICSTLS